ncbi:uncharacterized protein V1516DRAFT_671567 [Lipomyces oligophaga]|uniref:uncharacterized protein n=1 Tax=Lipomyces oligophaga TaxID=45792 RepID=UPI0034CDE57B
MEAYNIKNALPGCFYYVKACLIFASGLLDVAVGLATFRFFRFVSRWFPQLSATGTVMAASSLWGYLLFLVQTVKGCQISFSGDALDPRTSAILICNHRSMADYFLLAALSTFYRVNGYLVIVNWRSVFTVPSLKWLFLSLWVRQDWTLAPEEMQKLFSLFHSGPYWMTIFPEVICFDSDVAFEHRRYCSLNGLTELHYCLYPRFEASVPILSYLMEQATVDYVYDITFFYEKNSSLGTDPKFVSSSALEPSSSSLKSSDPKRTCTITTPTLRDILFDKAQTWHLHVHVDRLPVAAIPRDEIALERWLERVWIKKDRLLASVQKKGLSYRGLGFVYYPGDQLESDSA